MENESLVAALLVVGFHHAYGPIVELCVPPLPQQNQQKQTVLEKLELPDEWSFLPFLALPGNINISSTEKDDITENNICGLDGAHQKDEDFAYFHLPPVPGWPVAETTLFGISCNRQIATKVNSTLNPRCNACCELKMNEV